MKNSYLKLITLDAVISVASLISAFLLRFEFTIPSEFSGVLLNWIPWFTTFQIIVFYFTRLYARIWRYTSLFDLYAILGSVAISSALALSFVFFTMGQSGYPRSVLILYFILNSIFTVGSRLSVRVYYSHYHDEAPFRIQNEKKSILLIGAGKTGEKIAREILTTSRKKFSLVGFVDDNLEKKNALLHGRTIYGNVASLLDISVRYDELLITAPSATGEQMRRIVEICKQTGKPYKTVPGMSELIDREITLDNIRDVSYADLLGREEIVLDMESIKNLLSGKRVLVTGAGGSIGSELVRQCSTFNPSEIICLDISEEKIYNLEQSFSEIRSNTIMKTVLASVYNENECEKVFIENRPQIVFHAAAYKHVPIQEVHPWTAVRTNIKGTLNLIELSDRYSVDKFVLVSTDKAVNPKNVMGATKRFAEKVIESFNLKSKTTFMAVRFGNVLGSSGSAIPTFQRQINKGGPITITHPDMTRYFMSIQEASQLIIQCGVFGKDGEIFLLEMGKPIKIIQMAKDLIRLSGLEPEVDIPIVYTGLRPGEKLYEELKLHNERKVTTNHKKIVILKETQPPEDWSLMKQKVQVLLDTSSELNSDKIKNLLKQMLPAYSPSTFHSDLNEKAHGVSSNGTIKGEA